MSTMALDGVKVLEFAGFISGPYCSKLIADLGAEVIKLEDPKGGDDARGRGPFLGDMPHRERSGLFLYLNTNKMGITMDINTKRGREIFKEMIVEMDVLIEDNPPSVMKKLELSYQHLKEINPKLIMTSITPFGQTGPYRDYKAYNLNLSHVAGGGFMNPLGSSNYDREPIKAPGFMDDYLCGLSAATATLSAIFSRSITGEGQHIDISKQQALINLDRVEFDHYPNQGKIAHRVPTEVYEGGLSYIKCKDGYVVAVAMNDRQWESIVNMMGQPEWAKDERFASMESRIEHSEVLQTLMGEELLNFTKEEIYHGGQIGGGMVGMVCSIDEVVNSKQLSTRGFFVDIDHPEAGRLKYPSASYQFSKTPWRVRMAAPLLGEHNEEIYINRLGYSDDEFVKLRMGGVI